MKYFSVKNEGLIPMFYKGAKLELFNYKWTSPISSSMGILMLFWTLDIAASDKNLIPCHHRFNYTGNITL